MLCSTEHWSISTTLCLTFFENGVCLRKFPLWKIVEPPWKEGEIRLGVDKWFFVQLVLCSAIYRNVILLASLTKIIIIRWSLCGKFHTPLQMVHVWVVSVAHYSLIDFQTACKMMSWPNILAGQSDQKIKLSTTQDNIESLMTLKET